MKINNKDIKIYNCRCLKFLPSTSNYTFDSFSNETICENNRDIDAIFLFEGTKYNMQKNISKLIEDIKSSIIESGSLFYKVCLNDNSKPDILTNNSVKLALKLELLDLYEDEKSITKNTNFNITINSPKECYVNLELNATTNVISYTVKINDNEIVVNNIKGGETVYIGSGKVIAGGKSKIEDVDIWEFPRLKPGINKIEVSRADVNLTIKYNERW